MPCLMPGRKANSYRRIEVITGRRGRRRWTAAEKARIVAESFEADANISEVARRNGVSRGLLTVWRRQVAVAVAGKAPSFVPIHGEAVSGDETTGEPARVSSAQTRPLEIAARVKLSGAIEIEVGGARIRVEPGVELATLSTVLSALRGIR